MRRISAADKAASKEANKGNRGNKVSRDNKVSKASRAAAAAVVVVVAAASQAVVHPALRAAEEAETHCHWSAHSYVRSWGSRVRAAVRKSEQG